jgi:large subunit ribosomal protein L17
MKHGVNYRKLGRPTSQRWSLLRSLATSLIKHDRITTTVAKAKELRRIAEKMVTFAKRGTETARKSASAILYEQSLMPKLFDTMAERYKNRPGGYTRIMRTTERFGDKAEMAIIEYVDSPNELGLGATIRKINRLKITKKNLNKEGDDRVLHPESLSS